MKNLMAKRNSPFFVVLFFAVIFSLGLAACKGDVVPDEPEVQDSYTVTFNTNGGNTIEPKTVAAGKKVSKPKKPVREGAIFEGWYSDAAFQNAYNFKTPVNSNITLYAKWKILKNCTITFNSNGGTSVSSISLYEGNIPVMPENPTREGYTFKGWFTDSELTQVYVASAVDSDILLYASWELNVYPVSFDTEGGTAIATQMVEHGKTAKMPDAEPTRPYCVFKDWYTDKYTGTSSDKKFNFDQPITKPTTIYAGWNIYGYTVTFSGASVPMQILNPNGSEAAEEPAAPTKKGYDFIGWYSDEEFTTPYDFSAKVTQNITIYAKWEIQKYAVTFYYATAESFEVEVEYKQKVAKPADPQVTGYDFTGWYIIGNDGNYVLYDFKTPVTAPVTLYGTFEIQIYEINFVTNCEEDIPSQNVAYGNYINYQYSMNNTGYTFAGWYTDPENFSDETRFTYEENCSTKPVLGPLTLYAKWDVKQCVINFVTFTGGSSIAPMYVEYGNSLTQLPTEDPSRAYNGINYTFDGWYWDLNYSDPVNVTDPQIIYDDCNIYAKWISDAPVSFRVSMDVNTSDVTGSYYDDGKYIYLTVNYANIDFSWIFDERWNITTPDGYSGNFGGNAGHDEGKSTFQFNKSDRGSGIYVIEWTAQLNGQYDTDSNWYSYTWILEVESNM